MTQGTTNGPTRGNTEDRRRRRAWLMVTYASDVAGFARCYRCGIHLYNPDDLPKYPLRIFEDRNLVLFRDDIPDPDGRLGVWIRTPLGDDELVASALTVDRIIPGCKGGTYRRNNIRPACGRCNSETGAALKATL